MNVKQVQLGASRKSHKESWRKETPGLEVRSEGPPLGLI